MTVDLPPWTAAASLSVRTTLPRSALEGKDATHAASCRTTCMARMSQIKSSVNVNFRVESTHDVDR